MAAHPGPKRSEGLERAHEEFKEAKPEPFRAIRAVAQATSFVPFDPAKK